jgi:hypothetical protein
MNRRTRRTLVIVAAVLLLLALAVFLRSKAPPEAARLLPESDGIVYIDLKPIRAFMPKRLNAPQRVPEYQQFVDATGIDWERDLDQAAIALHRMPDPNGPNGPVAYSIVLVGKLNGKRLNAWLAAHSESREVYAARTIYNIPSEGRTVRVSQIGYDMVAISNTPTPEQIHSIIDRHRTAALPFAGSSVLEQYYHEVPLLAVVWGVGKIGLPFSQSGAISVLGLRLPLPADSTVIASLAPTIPITGSLHFEGLLRFRVEEIARDESVAAGQAQDLGTIVSLFRQISSPLADTPVNRGFKELLTTAAVTRQRDRVVVTASLPASFVAGLVEGQGEGPSPSPAPAMDISK